MVLVSEISRSRRKRSLLVQLVEVAIQLHHLLSLVREYLVLLAVDHIGLYVLEVVGLVGVDDVRNGGGWFLDFSQLVDHTVLLYHKEFAVNEVEGIRLGKIDVDVCSVELVEPVRPQLGPKRLNRSVSLQFMDKRQRLESTTLSAVLGLFSL